MPRASRNVYTQSTTTRIVASFHSEEGLNIDEPVSTHPDLGKIIGVTYAKGFGAAAGTWSLTIKKAKQNPGSLVQAPPHGLWRDPEDVWVRVQILTDGQPHDLFVGLIDTIGEKTGRTGSGMRSETYTLNGRDVGKILETTELFVNFFANTAGVMRSQSAIMDLWMNQVIGTPAHFVRLLIEVWLGNYGTAETPWRLPPGLGGGPFHSPGLPDGKSHRLALDGSGMTGIQSMSGPINGEAITPTLMQIDQGGGKLWDVLQEYSNGLMNELFIDLAPAAGAPRTASTGLVPTLTLRERPFPTRSADGSTSDVSKWNRLVTHDLALGDVQDREITKGGAGNRFNYYKLRINGLGSEGFSVDDLLQRGVEGVETGKPGNMPIFDSSSIAKHGVRPYTGTSRFIPIMYRARADETEADAVRIQEQLQANFFRLAAVWLKKVHDWYSVAPYDLTGTIKTSRVQPEIRIGQRVREIRPEGTIVYYVEAVAHSCNYPGAGATSLTVTRGEYEGDDVLGYVYQQLAAPRARSEAEICGAMSPELVAGLATGEELSAAANAEMLEQLAAGCGFDLRTNEVLLDNQTGMQDDFTTEFAEDSAMSIPTQLEMERDGTTARPSTGTVGDETVLDDSIPEVGDAEEIPPAGGPPPQAGQLERQEPFTDLEGLDDENSSNDPLAGLF